MKVLCFTFPVLWALFSSQVRAATLTVGPGQLFSTITQGITAAVSGDIVQVYPNPPNHYQENITLKSGVVVAGIEPAQTKIVGTGTGNTVTVVDGGTIMNMTIMNTNTATGSSALFVSGVTTTASITNNLIVRSNVGIDCRASSGLTITNNTIDKNSRGVLCSGGITNMTFENNIISNNTTSGIDFSGATVTGTTDYNDVYNNASNSYVTGTNDFSGDPKFVDPNINDYHLQAGSVCLNTGDPAISYNDKEVSATLIGYSRNDCGAYGGMQRDTTPFQIQNPAATPGTDSVSLTWTANLAYDIHNYTVYFDNQNHTVTNDVPSPPYYNALTVPATVANCPSSPSPSTCAITISLTLAAPTSLQASFGDRELLLSWGPPSGFNLVTGYNIYFKANIASTWTMIPAGNVTSYTLTGLTNLTVYDIYVTAVASSTYHFNVIAQDDYTIPHVSELRISDVTATINGGTATEGPASGTVSNFPETLSPYPDLPNRGGCFIATAAYGSPWEPQVRLLRSFRDKYLQPYDRGRRFIAWYYRISPPWAEYLNEHPWLKPVVRTGLMPAVGFSYLFVVMTGIKRSLIFLLVMLCLIGGMFIIKKIKRSQD